MSEFTRTCARCDHSSDDHHFYDSDSPTDPHAMARCVWTADRSQQGLDRDCQCPDFEADTDADTDGETAP